MKNADYEQRIKSLDWNGLRELFPQIEARNTPGWEPGKAFEYLVPRVFELDGARKVRWPYEIKLHGHIVEQIDGAVEAAGLHCLLECKNQEGLLAIAPLAKLRNQLLRRPAASVGLIFTTSAYTQSAHLLAGYLGSQTILWWYYDKIKLAVDKGRIIPLLEAKHHACVEEGVHDMNTATDGVL